MLPRLDEARQAAVGRRLGTLVGRLGHMVQPRPGRFTDPALTIGDLPPGSDDLAAWVGEHTVGLRSAGWDDGSLAGLVGLAERSQSLLDEERRTVLAHADLNAKNVLVDPDSLEVTGVVDWEYASPARRTPTWGTCCAWTPHRRTPEPWSPATATSCRGPPTTCASAPRPPTCSR